MMRYLVACGAVPLLFACTPSGGNNQSSSQARSAATPQAMTEQQAMQAFGLIGTWATDCSQPASSEDEHDSYTLEGDGTVGEVDDDGTGAAASRYSWNQAVLVDQDTLQIDGIFYGNNLAQHTVLQKNSAGQMRVFGNVDGSGKVLVQNGAFANGGDSPWTSRCP